MKAISSQLVKLVPGAPPAYSLDVMEARKDIEFRPSYLARDRQGFSPALSVEEFNARRRLVTELALADLGSTTSVLSNVPGSHFLARENDIRCDAEGPRRESRTCKHARRVGAVTGLAIIATAAVGFLTQVRENEVRLFFRMCIGGHGNLCRCKWSVCYPPCNVVIAQCMNDSVVTYSDRLVRC